MWRRAAGAVLLLWAALMPSVAASRHDNAALLAALPTAAEWKRHLEQDILPFWETPAALGVPIGSFPTFRCNDGSLYDARLPCPEFRAAPAWIRAGLGRQYVRMISRQAYLYGVAYHLTGNVKYLALARSGVFYIIQHAFDPDTGNVVSYWQDGKPAAAAANRSSQDVAYCLEGLAFYYYLTRDPAVLQAILRIERHIRATYYDPLLGFYRLRVHGTAADQPDLVAQLDQVNAYMLLLSRLLPPPYQAQWRAELAGLAEVIRGRFYDPHTAMFVGEPLVPKAQAACVFDGVDTDFGHTIKAYWMLYLSGRTLGDVALEKFAATRVPRILRWAYRRDSGSWATRPLCGGKAGDVDRTSTWWMSAELDQAALTLGLKNAPLLAYIPATYRFWLQHMVDHRHGEVWNEVSLPDLTPRLPKVEQWKNGYHTAEHAMVGYITATALQAQPLALYFAFAACRMPAVVEPYFFEAAVSAHSETPLPGFPGFCRQQVTFAGVH